MYQFFFPLCCLTLKLICFPLWRTEKGCYGTGRESTKCILVLRVPDSYPRSQKRLQLLRWHLARDASNNLRAVT